MRSREVNAVTLQDLEIQLHTASFFSTEETPKCTECYLCKKTDRLANWPLDSRSLLQTYDCVYNWSCIWVNGFTSTSTSVITTVEVLQQNINSISWVLCNGLEPVLRTGLVTFSLIKGTKFVLRRAFRVAYFTLPILNETKSRICCIITRIKTTDAVRMKGTEGGDAGLEMVIIIFRRVSESEWCRSIRKKPINLKWLFNLSTFLSPPIVAIGEWRAMIKSI
jgi:hypothetical protein